MTTQTDYTCWGISELIEHIKTLELENAYTRETIERVVKILAQSYISNIDYQEARIELYEALGLTRSDAQGAVEAEDLNA